MQIKTQDNYSIQRIWKGIVLSGIQCRIYCGKLDSNSGRSRRVLGLITLIGVKYTKKSQINS